MVKLIAYQAFEGSGILEVDGRLCYIDFPYTKKNELPISEHQVGRLINHVGFEAANLEFEDGPSVIAFLRSKASEGADPFAGETQESMLEKFNSLGVKNLDGIVESIRIKYIEKHQYGRAIRGLDRIKGLEVVRSESQLHLKVMELLLHCHEEIAIAYAFKMVPIKVDSLESTGHQTKKIEDRFPTLNGNSTRNLQSLEFSFSNIGR